MIRGDKSSVKVVFFSWPQYSHTTAALPVIDALINQGIDVYFFGGEEFKPLFVNRKLTFVPYTVEKSGIESIKNEAVEVGFNRLCIDSSVAHKIDACITGFYGEGVSAKQLRKLLKDSVIYKTSELVCHPGFIDEQLQNEDSYCDLREKELSILTLPEIKQLIENLSIELISNVRL